MLHCMVRVFWCVVCVCVCLFLQCPSDVLQQVAEGPQQQLRVRCLADCCAYVLEQHGVQPAVCVDAMHGRQFNSRRLAQVIHGGTLVKHS